MPVIIKAIIFFNCTYSNPNPTSNPNPGTKFHKFIVQSSRERLRDYLFHDGDPYHIEVSPLICSANQWTGFYMIETSIIKGLKQKRIVINGNYQPFGLRPITQQTDYSFLYL